MNRFSLTSLKNGTKLLAICLFLFSYGLLFFTAGKFITREKFQNFFASQQSGIDDSGKNIDTPLPYSETETQNVIASYAKLCSNTVYGFELAYPKEWFTTYNLDDEQCRYFAPYSFIVPQDTGQQFVPVKIDVVTLEDWQQTVSFFKNPNDFQNVVSVENLDLNSRLVQKIKSTTTGEGVLPKNLLKTTYLVFDSSRPLVVTYQQLTIDENPQEFEKFLEEMVASINFF